MKTLNGILKNRVNCDQERKKAWEPIARAEVVRAVKMSNAGMPVDSFAGANYFKKREEEKCAGCKSLGRHVGLGNAQKCLRAPAPLEIDSPLT
jgi:hypothetical protein